MDGKAENSGNPWQGRDLVRLYAGLTKTLENHCGAERFARHMAGMRHASGEPKPALPAEPALVRFFRRLGLTGADDDMGRFLPLFLRLAGEAVARPEAHVLGLVRALCLGIGDLDAKPVCGTVPECRSCGLTKFCDHFNSPRKPEMAAWPPAKRLLSGAEEALSDAELLAVVLFGDKAAGTEPLVRSLLDRYGQLRAVVNADPGEYKGMRDASGGHVLRLASVSALYRRLLAEKRGAIPRITCAKDLYDRYAPELREYRTEASVLVMLDRRNGIVRDAWFCDGQASVASLDIASLLRLAIQGSAAGVALVHNHPAGDSRPSDADRDFTRRLRSACETVGLLFVDHVIVTENGYYSFAEEGRLEM